MINNFNVHSVWKHADGESQSSNSGKKSKNKLDFKNPFKSGFSKYVATKDITAKSFDFSKERVIKKGTNLFAKPLTDSDIKVPSNAMMDVQTLIDNNLISYGGFIIDKNSVTSKNTNVLEKIQKLFTTKKSFVGDPKPLNREQALKLIKSKI